MGTAQNWSRENLAWAAGLFEGEGCITRRRQRDANLVMTMTDEDVVRKFHSVIGHGRVYGPYMRHSGLKPQWRWSCTGSQSCIAVLAALWCFLGKRRKARAEIALLELATVRSRNTKLCQRGHPFDEENTILERGGRVCRRCKYDGMNRRAKEKRRLKREQKNGANDIRNTSDRSHKRAA